LRRVLWLLVLLLDLPTWAGNARGPFADVPVDHWAYAAVARLEERGYPSAFAAATFDGERPRVRYEFAVAVQRMLDEARRRKDSARPNGRPSRRLPKSDSISDPIAEDALARLRREFRRELKMLRKDLEGLKYRSWPSTDRQTRAGGTFDRPERRASEGPEQR
jgi:hypothetical protein